MTLPSDSPASRLSALASALQKARNAPTEAEALAAVGVAPDGCSPLNPEPSIASIIATHRAVCTASAAQIIDLEARIAAALEWVLRDARRQLQTARAEAGIFTSGPWRDSAVSEAEAIWRRQNPGLSAVVGHED